MPLKYNKLKTHEDRARIEFELARGGYVPAIARKYGVARTTLYRFRKNLPPQLRAARLAKRLKSQSELEDLRVEESTGLLQNLAQQRARLLLVQDCALEANNITGVVFASQSIQQNLKIVARLLGEFAEHQIKTSISVLITPEYLNLRSTLLRALRPFPEAARAVAAALHETESAAAAQAPMIDVTPSEQTSAPDAH
jgi:transposase-like protein